MISSETKLRVRYDETDAMGYMYHGNYPAYYHVGRTELLRSIGLDDRFLQEHRTLLPVIEMNMKFLKPAFYDDLLRIKTKLVEVPQSRFKFRYEIYNQENKLINKAESVLVFVDIKTRKPKKVPTIITEKLKLLNEN